MKTKMLLAAASTLAIAACGGAETETDVAEVEQDELRVADNDDGAVETLLSDEQPPLEGDNPFDDTGIDVDDEFAEADAELDEFGNEIEAEAGEFGRDTERLASDMGSDLNDDFDGDIDSFGDRVDAEASEFGRDTERLATDMGRDMDRRAVDTTRRADVAPTVTDGVSAKTYTARNTDAYIAQDGELITGSEAALLAGSYDVMIGDDRRSLPLTISGEGDMATGTFDGEPIQVAVTGRNFQFDAPVDMDGETTLMTFTGTYMDGEIDNGVVEAQGDGSTMTFSAERTSDYNAIPTTDANVDTDRDMDMDRDMDRDMNRRDMDDRSMTAPTIAPLPRATTRTGSPDIGDPGYDYEDDDREVVDSVRSDIDMLENDDVPEVPAEELPYGADDDYDTEMNEPLGTTTRSTPITPRTNYDSRVTEDDEADRLMREQMEDEDDNRPTGIMRRGTSELEEPLDARGDTYLEEDSGFAEEDLDTMNREVDGRDQAIDPLTDDDDALDEAMDDDPNFDF